MFKAIFYIVIGIIGTSMLNTVTHNAATQKFTEQFFKVPISTAQAESTKTVDSINGLVVAVSDGDTLTVRSSYGDVNVRLFAIDAPEAKCHGFSDKVCQEDGQPGATASKLYLRQLVLNKNVDVTLGQGMSYNRLVGTVLSDGKDINLEMVKAGHAWHYKFYSKNQSADDKKAYADAELNAKWVHAGLWETPNPVAPWDYRKLK